MTWHQYLSADDVNDDDDINHVSGAHAWTKENNCRLSMGSKNIIIREITFSQRFIVEELVYRIVIPWNLSFPGLKSTFCPFQDLKLSLYII